MKVILVSGKAESGKNYVANLIMSSLVPKYSVLQIAFGDYLKFLCRRYLGWNGKKDEAGRNMLQYVGTSVCRKHDPYFFASKVVEFLRLFHSRWNYVIITDWRFMNEYEAMRDFFDVTTVRVERPGYVNKFTKEQKEHISETGLDYFDFDWIIFNDEKVEAKVKTMMEEIINGEH